MDSGEAQLRGRHGRRSIICLALPRWPAVRCERLTVVCLSAPPVCLHTKVLSCKAPSLSGGGSHLQSCITINVLFFKRTEYFYISLPLSIKHQSCSLYNMILDFSQQSVGTPWRITHFSWAVFLMIFLSFANLLPSPFSVSQGQ